MKHIEHATHIECSAITHWDGIIENAKRSQRIASAEKRAIAERCRQRARVLRAKHEGAGK